MYKHCSHLYVVVLPLPIQKVVQLFLLYLHFIRKRLSLYVYTFKKLILFLGKKLGL